ncbi:MAG: histidinol dehydrogenase [Acidimicrobiales bacterium]
MPLTHLDLRGASLAPAQLAAKLPRPEGHELPIEAVAEILAQVRAGGDQALRDLTLRFDGVAIGDLAIDPEVPAQALKGLDQGLRRALEVAWERILAYHEAEPPGAEDVVGDGVRVRQLLRPVGRAGIYAPGGRAKYPSTVLMCSAPARVAGVRSVALCVPPGPDGDVATETLAAAAIAGVDEIYRVGGAQAVAGMAFGTESIAAVDVIVGPGNRYVAEAKRQVSGVVGVASAFAGPSEVVVVADQSTPALWAATDLAVQAEHGPDGMAWLVTWSESVVDEVERELDALVAASARRADLEATLARGGVAVLVDGPDAAMAVCNAVAPEHLELLVTTDMAEALLPAVRCAGAVFLGPLGAASIGDYIAGPNHVLPTARTARFASALRVDDFRTHIHAVSVDETAIEQLGPHVVRLAEAEGLPAHASSIRVRMERP